MVSSAKTNPLITLCNTSTTLITLASSDFAGTVVEPTVVQSAALTTAKLNAVPMLGPSWGVTVTEVLERPPPKLNRYEVTFRGHRTKSPRCYTFALTTLTFRGEEGTLSHAWNVHLILVGYTWQTIVFDARYKRDPVAVCRLLAAVLKGLGTEEAAVMTSHLTSAKVHDATFDALQSNSTCTRWANYVTEALANAHFTVEQDVQEFIDGLPAMRGSVEFDTVSGGSRVLTTWHWLSAVCAAATLASAVMT